MSQSRESQDFEFDPLTETTVLLSPAAFDWAIRVTQADAGLNPWPGFLRALALQGFQQWLEAGALDLTIYYDPEQVPPAGINCRVGDFRLCLITQGSLNDDVVQIPKAALDTPGQFAHLFVLIEVQEEAGRVTILSGLRCDSQRLALKNQGRFALQSTAGVLLDNLDSDDIYTIPVQWFDIVPEELLLYLNCLNPEQLTATLSPAPDAGSAQSSLIGGIINVGRWLQNQLGPVADQLAWTLLPPLSQLDEAMAMRTRVEEFAAVLGELSPQVKVPAMARGACTDCQSQGLVFRLYAFTWPLAELDNSQWSLLLLLGPLGDGQLPPGMQLLIRDSSSLLVEETLEPDSEATYLYGQVVGDWDETFVATVQLPDGSLLTWPPFAFNPEA